MNRKLAAIIPLTLALVACGSSTETNEEKINGMDGHMAAMLCQKQVAKRAGIARDDMADVDLSAARQIRVDDDVHWHYSAKDQKIPGGQYSCNIFPESADKAKVEVN